MNRNVKRSTKKKLQIGEDSSNSLNQNLLDDEQQPQSYNNINNNFNSEQKQSEISLITTRKEVENDKFARLIDSEIRDTQEDAELKKQEEQQQQEQKVEEQVKKPSKYRLVCLDIFRGLTMTGMILVDNNGTDDNVIWPLNHSYWNGWTTADQVFPNFLFIMGLAIPFAIKDPEAECKQGKTWFKVLKRGILLFVIGLLINMEYTIPSKYERDQPGYEYCFYFRILGIMQRLGICYIVCTAIYLTVRKLWVQGVIYTAILIIFLGFTYGYPVPSYSFKQRVSTCDFVDVEYDCDGARGYTTGPLQFACNFEGYLDAMILGPKFDWGGHTRPTDPEGFWGYLPSLFNTFMGLCSCLIFKKYKNDNKKLATYWGLLGFSLGCLGFFLNAMGIPLNKSIWSISFMFATAGMSLISLVFIFILVDIFGKDKTITNVLAAPFKWLGMNPLFIYCMMMLSQGVLMINVTTSSGEPIWDYILDKVFYSWISNKDWANAVCALAYWLFWTIIAGILYTFKIFIKL